MASYSCNHAPIHPSIDPSIHQSTHASMQPSRLTACRHGEHCRLPQMMLLPFNGERKSSTFRHWCSNVMLAAIEQGTTDDKMHRLRERGSIGSAGRAMDSSVSLKCQYGIKTPPTNVLTGVAVNPCHRQAGSCTSRWLMKSWLLAVGAVRSVWQKGWSFRRAGHCTCRPLNDAKVIVKSRCIIARTLSHSREKKYMKYEVVIWWRSQYKMYLQCFS